VRTAAAQSSHAAAVSAGRSGKVSWRRFCSLGPSRLAAIAFVLVLCAGTAMAATGVWDPPLGAITGRTPPLRSESPVPKRITDVLGILRRKQTWKDRSLGVEETLSRATYADGIRLDSVRYLWSDVEGMAGVLFSVRRPNPVPHEPREQLCLYPPAFRRST